MFVTALVILLIGVATLGVALRGRMEGDEPHCRTCGFNLRGRDPASTRCPECGAGLNEQSIRIGVRRRARGLLWVAALLLLVGGGVCGSAGWRWAQRYGRIRWEPTSWLLQDVEAGPGPKHPTAVRELIRHTWLSIIDAAGVAGRVCLRPDQSPADRAMKLDTYWGEEIVASNLAVDAPGATTAKAFVATD